MDNSVIIALDFPEQKQVLDFLERFENERLFLKVGMELFYWEGPAIIHRLKEMNHNIFLDLKLHDIPNTVRNAMKSLAGLGCDLVNVHAAGGMDMMEAAVEGLDAGTQSGRTRPLCIAVTQLTSTSEQQMKNEQLVHVPLSESVLHYSKLAHMSGLDGVVCAVHEAKLVRAELGGAFLTVTPGIRLANDDMHDQKRVATPKGARSHGVSAIVVGRPITSAENPLESYEKIKQEWAGVQQ
ncbi:orotidine-5'-phosphate decarboxylase [Bacillus sp. T33-2]|uniref:orotidine-5'-phosphate decarboxylase n=1 Tax=Bacillus sp. T33-2 TaxID=2054168 RepID=UPI000C760BFA|nr:orotidine-5'-phosphate decarboxylase [Bacillus sp. T33-2]PLR97345.1 orotidine-5'-phosphate decarboxylase [Bacillus sp. T33-2]